MDVYIFYHPMYHSSIVILFSCFWYSVVFEYHYNKNRLDVSEIEGQDRVIKELYNWSRFTRNAVMGVLEPFCLSCDQTVYTNCMVCFVTLKGVPPVLC